MVVYYYIHLHLLCWCEKNLDVSVLCLLLSCLIPQHRSSNCRIRYTNILLILCVWSTTTNIISSENQIHQCYVAQIIAKYTCFRLPLPSNSLYPTVELKLLFHPPVSLIPLFVIITPLSPVFKPLPFEYTSTCIRMFYLLVATASRIATFIVLTGISLVNPSLRHYHLEKRGQDFRKSPVVS